jgi:hypothetical protein
VPNLFVAIRIDKVPTLFVASRRHHVIIIMFTLARDILLETPWRIIIPNPSVNSHSLWS